ncbi:MAG: hypothetical protein OEV40_02535 [Acidimicrobiia bacterium]|nr:hypothetical protein [Acidimicrobiia bacterium]
MSWPGRRPAGNWPLLVALVVAGLAVGAACASPSAGSGTAGSTATPADPPVPRFRFGVAIGRAGPQRLAELEAEAGATVGMVRVFARWDTEFPTADHQRLLDDGRVIHLSVRPRTEAGEVIPWQDLARVEPTSAQRRLDQWTKIVAGYGRQVYFTLNHEPETADSAANGTAAEFIAAWRRTVTLLRQNGGAEVRTVFVLGQGAYADGTAESWYPGDDVVDVIGADPYNWYRCQGTDRAWAAPDDLIRFPLAFARQRGKPLALPEIASTEDPEDPGRKAAWIEELAALLASPGVVEHLEFVVWFSGDDPRWPDCRWSYDSSPRSAAAFSGMLARFEPPTGGA